MKKIFYFDSMLTPKIITLVYWLLLLAILLTGIETIFFDYQGVNLGSILSGIGLIIGGAIGARIWCELLIVLFKIHENLKKIADKT